MDWWVIPGLMIAFVAGFAFAAIFAIEYRPPRIEGNCPECGHHVTLTDIEWGR